MEFWTNYLGSVMWVFDPGGIPPWRNLQTGAYANEKPSGVDRKFNPSGPYSAEDAQLFPYASQHIEGFPAATGARAAPSSPSPRPPGGSTTIGIDPAFRGIEGAMPAGIGEVPELNPDDFYWRWDAAIGDMVPARPGEPGAKFSNIWWAEAVEARTNAASGGTGSGRTGPSAAELAIQQSQVDAQNLATFISGTIAELEIEVDSRRLSTEQAIGEFNKRLDAFSEAGAQFRGIQPYTIPIGAEYVPGRQPGGIGEQLGIAPRKAEVIQFDPFAMATDIVNQSPNLTDIGVPSGDALAEAIAIAEGFLGG